MDKNIIDKTTIINGTPRNNGNTDAIIKNFYEGLKSVNLTYEELILRDLSIANCIGCYLCKQEVRCNFDDDMTYVRKVLETSEILVFASPVYWCEITGLMKTFFDRLYFYHHKENAELIAGKKAIIISTMGVSESIKYETELIMEFYKRALKSLKISILDIKNFSDLMEKEAIEKHPEYKKDAFELGAELISKL